MISFISVKEVDTIDLKNFTFGYLRVKETFESTQGYPLCRCVCVCKSEVNVLPADLLSGRIFSCGCTQDQPQFEMQFIGKRWGQLTAIKHMGYDIKEWNGRKEKRSLWLFRCDCGTEKIMYLNNVRYSNVRSCGCLALKNITNLRKAAITGQQFGRLTALRPTERRSKNGSIIWELSCQCGNITYKTANELKCGLVTSCGCLYKESRNKCNSYRTDYINHTSISSIVASKKLSAANKSGYTGVFYNKKKEKWQAYICYQRQNFHLGYYDDIAEAIAARREAEQLIHDPIVIENWNLLSKNQKASFSQYLMQKLSE